MKKCCLFFITLLYASISLSIKSAEALPKEEMTFSLKNSDKSGESIFFIAVNNGRLQVGLIKSRDWLDGVFDLTGTTRLYIWGENLENSTSEELRENLKNTVLANHDMKIDQISFPLKPNWAFEFPKNKTIHVKWKHGKLQPRDGNSKFSPSKGMGKYTKEGYSLRNNVTGDDFILSSWKFDGEKGQWLDAEAMAREEWEMK